MLTNTGFYRLIVVSLAIVGLSAPAAWAQAPAAAPSAPPSAEAAATAWELQAKAVAAQMKLNDEKTAKLVDAYKAARASHQKARDEKLGEGGPRSREAYEAMRAVTEAERAKFETALKAFLTPEETQKAMATLGSFSRRFDQLVVVLEGMKLDKEKQAQAMDVLLAYVAETGTMMTQAGPDADREALRAKMQAAQEKMNAEMAKVLTEEQMAKWREASSRRRGRQ